MELAIATPKGIKGTVEVSEAAFGMEFNQDLGSPSCGSVFWLAPDRVPGLRRTVLLFLAVVVSHSLRKELVALVLALYAVQSGAGGGVTFAAQPQDHSQKIKP